MSKDYKEIHKDTICSNCGRNYSSSRWLKTYDKDGNWYPHENKYHCKRCHYYFNPNTGEFSEFSKDFDNSKKSELSFLDYYIKDKICSKCGSKTTSGNWRKKRDENGNWDGKYVCTACYLNPACRSGKLNPNSTKYKGIIGELTVAKVLGYEYCDIKSQNSQFDIDSKKYMDNKYGRIEVKTSLYNPIKRIWIVSGIKPGFFDTLFILCTDKKFENIERVYIIPGDKVDVSGTAIYENPSRGGWYEEFRIDNIKPYQEAFQTVKNDSQLTINN